MKTKIIIGAFITLCAVTIAFIPAQAQRNEKPIPATHMWILTGNAVVHVYANTLKQCELLTQQAAMINSSEADCYNGEILLKRINCQKSTQSSSAPNCR